MDRKSLVFTRQFKEVSASKRGVLLCQQLGKVSGQLFESSNYEGV